MFSLKAGVSIKGMRPEIIIGLLILKDVFDKYKADFVLTAGTDGKHMQGSLHYQGMAADIRTSVVTPELLSNIVKEAKKNLGADFDLINEGDHLHLEHDPKG